MELALNTKATAALPNEQGLVEAARRGDDRAFEQLYALYRDRVTAFIHSKVRDHGRAEDISQEVFMAALRQLRSNEHDIAFKPWIFAIAKNACIDEFRRSARGREVPVETDDDFPTDQRASLSIVPSPPAAIESKQRLDDLRGAFGGLSESHHRLLVMRELEGRSYDEIGNRLGMTRQMVESGLFRARRKLSEEYADLASGRRCEQVQTAIDSGGATQLKALGIKERRRLTQHLSHCQPCRHQARLAGVDETLLKPRSIAAKIAAMLPFGGFWRWPWRRGASKAAGAHASSHVAGSGAAQAAGTAGSSITLGQAAAAVAALAVAGAGGAIAIAQHADHAQRAPAHSRHVSTSSPAGAAPTAGVSPAASSPAAASAARGATARARVTGTRATATRSSHARTLGPRPGRAHRGHTGTPPAAGGQPTSTPAAGSGSGASVLGTPSSTLSSSGNAVKNVLTTTINKPVQTVSKLVDPVKKATNPITDPITRATNPIISPVTKVTAPVTKAVDPVLSAPVKSVTSPVGTVPPPSSVSPSTPSTGSSSSTGSPPSAGATPSTGANTPGGSGGSQGPVTTIKRVLSGL